MRRTDVIVINDLDTAPEAITLALGSAAAKERVKNESVAADLLSQERVQTFDDMNDHCVGPGVGGGTGVVASVSRGDLGHQESGGAPSGLGHYRDATSSQE